MGRFLDWLKGDCVDPDGNIKRKAKYGERCCGDCANCIDWMMFTGEVCFGGKGQNPKLTCRASDFAGDCKHFMGMTGACGYRP